MNLDDFHNKGYCVIDDFLPESEAKFILEKFSSIENWRQVDQKRDHYKKGGPFLINSKYMPNSEEFYLQRTKRPDEFEQSTEWREIFESKLLNSVEKFFSRKTVKDTTYVLKYEENDFSRVHTDDYRGDVDRVDIGILYYLCKNWIWDWGGLLLVGENSDSEDMQAILPKNNRIIFLNHQKRCPHSVTPVTNYALNERYCVASFIGCDKSF